MSPTELAAHIEHTILAPEATWPEVQRTAIEASANGFAAVCVSPVWVARTARIVQTGVSVCTVVGFPHGTNKPTLKAIEATSVIKDGADEIDVVAHLPNLIAADVDAVRAELIEIVRAARATRRDVVVKVIVESALLLLLGDDRGEQAIAAACSAVRESGCDYIKTSTGYHPAGGASVEAIRLMKQYGEGLLIKAAGGIKDLATAQAMLQAGADRLGMSDSLKIMEELRNAKTDTQV